MPSKCVKNDISISLVEEGEINEEKMRRKWSAFRSEPARGYIDKSTRRTLAVLLETKIVESFPGKVPVRIV